MLQFKKSYQKVKGILVSLNVKKDKDSQTGFLPYEYPSLLQELEPRLMFDGAAIETVDIADGVSDQEQAYILNSLEQNENAHATDSLLAAIEADPEGFQTDYSQFKEVVIIDARVQDPHVLINSISRDAAIEVILNNQDGVDRIAEILEKYKDLEALHIVSYGDQSQLNLGNAILNHESILDYSSQLHKWGLSLSDESNILFYGNNLGEDESGKAFVDQMKELTDKNILTNFDRVDVANESITPLQLLTIDDITSEQIEILDTAVNKVEATLNELSSGEYFYRVIETAFMNRYDKDLLDSLKSQWISSDFSHLPEIKIMSSNQILGGYSALENIIYLNKDILTSESSTYHVLLEEIGHFIDQHINKVDSNGDEGAIFASLLLDVKIPKEYLNQLKYENDNVLVTIGSKAFNIEAHQTHANRVINVTENGSGSANFEHTLGVWYEPPGWVVIFKDRVISSGTPSWVSWNNSSTWYNAGNLEYLNQGQTTSFTYQVWTEEWTQWFGSPVIFRSDRLSYYVTFNVTGENDNPIANVDAGTTTKNNVVFVDPLANDTDVDLDGNYANFSIVSASTPKGSVSINGKQIIFDPNSQFNYLLQGQSEVVNVSYTMSDQYGAQSSSTISITVNGVNVPPEALADVMITNEESINTIDPTSNDLILDAGTGPLSVSGVSAPKGIVSYMGNTVTFNPNGEFEYLSVGNSEIVNVSYAITDSRGLQDSSSIAVVVEGRNDAPVNSVLTAQSVQEDVLTAITGLFVSDVDAGSSTINTTLSVTNGTLDVSLAGGASIISGANNSTNITLSGTITQINAALATVQYQSNLHYNGADVLTILTDDGGNNGVGPSLQDTDTVNITVAPVNDAPVNSVTTSQSVQEDVLTTITGLSVSDVDVSSGTISTVLSVANGTLNVSLAGGASIISGANNSANLTLSGTITQINAALATVQYQSNLHYNGADVLTILTDDGGNTGSGGNLQDTDTVNITVTPVNDAPINSVLTAQSVQEDVLTTITGLSVSDVDVSSGTISTALSVTNGTLNVSLAGGASIISGANNSANVTLSGTITQINAALATVQYQSNLHYNGADVLTILTDDGGNAGSGGNLQDTDTVNITVTPVNDAPTSINQVRNIFINETYNFQITDFPYFDVENDAFHKIIIPNTVSKPTFQKLSDALVNGAEVLASDLINISYTPIYFEKGISHTSFSYQVDDGSIPSPVYSFTFNVLVAGDINQNGVIDVGEVAGDVDKNGIINDLEIAGDLDGDGIITALYEVSGDLNGNGVIDSPYEIAGDVNGNGLIDELGEIAGDVDGNGLVDRPDEIAGDVNGNGVIDELGEIAGDVDGNGLIDRPDEIAEDLNGNGVIGDLDEKVGNIIIHEANMKPQVSGSENKVSNEKINDAVVNYKQIDLAVKVDNVFSNNTQNILNEFGKALNERASVDTLSDIASTAIKETLESSSISDTSGIVKGLLKQAIDAGESTVRIAAIASSMLDVSRESSYGSDIVIRNIIQQIVDSGLSTDQIAQILSTMLLNTDDQYHDDFILSIVSESNVTDLHLYQMKQILEQQDPELSDKLSKEMQMIRGNLLSNALDETDSQTNPSNKGLLAKLKDMLLGNRQTQAEEMTSYDIKEHKYKIELAKAELLTMVRDRSVDDNQDRKKR
ncbi:DUF4347 domain-containing protein [Cysteiniphilum sp. JM-1]|uniref:DUF4347 domain-containing protein n=1 Tax=Cysteiniphilum sp. JM-1 TaxID=2610891 RepID=UPI001248C564|nr:DUF4347 domain-containing protein [Cysteiniphilum sp. JM-1]